MSNTKLTDAEIEEWNTLLEYIRRVAGYSEYIEWKKFFNNAIDNNISFREANDNKSVQEVLQTTPYFNFNKFAKTYRETDRLIYESAGVKKIEPDDDIYIDCQPVSVIGEVIDKDNNLFKSTNQGPAIFNDLVNNVSGDQILNNIGFQVLLGITLLGVFYGIGNYIFVKFPKKMINPD